MPKILRDHSTTGDIKGIAQSTILDSSAYVGVNDPLSSSSDVSNKPGSSIPSIFGRLIFFRTALQNIQPDKIMWNKAGAAPVYNQVVSQWLDAFELVFDNNISLSFEKWTVNEQVAALRNSNHHELADALENHSAKYLEGVTTLYLIYNDQNELIGGTSPFTFVFTSPNWNSGKPVQSLWERDLKFREFLYKTYLALDTEIDNIVYRAVVTAGNQMVSHINNPAKEGVRGFLTYMENCLMGEPDNSLKTRIESLRGKYLAQNLQEDYPIISFDFGEVKQGIKIADLSSESIDPTTKLPKPVKTFNMWLQGRSATDFTSDFFIDSDVVDFDRMTSPLVFAVGQNYNNMYFYDTKLWEDTISVPQIENINEASRKFPGDAPYRHNWLTAIDFLEDKLISLPYIMDGINFRKTINYQVSAQDGDKDKNRSCLLPIKPAAIKYFSLNKLDSIITVNLDQVNYQVEVCIDVPVRNIDNTRRNSVHISKIYDLNNDVVLLSPKVIGKSLSIGISPFIRLEDNNYTVALHYGKLDYDDVKLSFYKNGSIAPLENVNFTRRKTNPNSVYYKINNTVFDAIQLNIADAKNKPNLSGMVLPKMKDFTPGETAYYYSVDFGTTNTHIAYITDEPHCRATSFGAKDIAMQTVYLSQHLNLDVEIRSGKYDKVVTTLAEIYGKGGREISLIQAREFYPNFAGDDYTFPIRTVLYEEVGIEDDLYGKASIGFHYPKEKLFVNEYRTSIKWDLNALKVQNADIRALLFFEELLIMIRTHWLSQGNADLKNTPVLMLTYPLAMGSTSQMNRLWMLAYQRVFGTSGALKIKNMAESLAPAYGLISGGVNMVGGILNVDIGGGTTDIQYYRRNGNETIARYNSVLFAGDDLWGCGYENLGMDTRTVSDNIYTRFAGEVLKDEILEIGYNRIGFNEIRLTGKEFINMLLRDDKMLFTRAITTSSNGNNLPRKVALLHYGAIMWHIVNWVKNDNKMNEKFPEVINFTGFGSKYLTMLFDDNSIFSLQEYTKLLLKCYGVEVPDAFKIQFESNPKAVTAEGATICAKQGGAQRIQNRYSYHFGFENDDPSLIIKYRDIDDCKKKVYSFYKKFMEAFCKVESPNLNIPKFSDSEYKKIQNRVEASFEQVKTIKSCPDDEHGENKIDDSMFFWMLKGALYDLDN